MIIPRKASQKSLIVVNHFSCSAKDMQVYKTFLYFSNRCTPSPAYRHLAVTFSLSILCAVSPPPFVPVIVPFFRGSFDNSEMHFESSLHFLYLTSYFLVLKGFTGSKQHLKPDGTQKFHFMESSETFSFVSTELEKKNRYFEFPENQKCKNTY